MKYGACYVLCNEEDYLEYSLDSIYKYADKIYLLLGVPFNKGVNVKPDKTEEIIINYMKNKDIDKKIEFFKTDMRNESKCKNLLLDMCREDNMDYCWIVDGDEVYDGYLMKLLFNSIEKYKSEVVIAYCKEYWRSLQSIIALSENYIMFKVLDDLNIRVRCPARNVSSTTIDPNYFQFHHYGLARTPNKIREKYTITDNREKTKVDTINEKKVHGFNLEKWMKEKFLAWKKDRSITHLHPFNKKVWNKPTVRMCKDGIPKVMRKHKWIGIDCIEGEINEKI